MIKQTDTVYIAGPMTGRKLFNHPAFFGMAGLIEKNYSCRVLNPARQPLGLEYEDYMRHAMTDIAVATVVVLLEGWEESPGAQREHAAAMERGIFICRQHQLEVDLTQKYQTAHPEEN